MGPSGGLSCDDGFDDVGPVEHRQQVGLSNDAHQHLGGVDDHDLVRRAAHQKCGGVKLSLDLRPSLRLT